eukprot:UN22977
MKDDATDPPRKDRKRIASEGSDSGLVIGDAWTEIIEQRIRTITSFVELNDVFALSLAFKPHMKEILRSRKFENVFYDYDKDFLLAWKESGNILQKYPFHLGVDEISENFSNVRDIDNQPIEMIDAINKKFKWSAKKADGTFISWGENAVTPSRMGRRSQLHTIPATAKMGRKSILGIETDDDPLHEPQKDFEGNNTDLQSDVKTDLLSLDFSEGLENPQITKNTRASPEIKPRLGRKSFCVERPDADDQLVERSVEPLSPDYSEKLHPDNVTTLMH